MDDLTDDLKASLADLGRSLEWNYGADTAHTELTAQERDVLHSLEKRLYRLVIPNRFKLPPKLYHYTDERGIAGILSSHGIRATYARDLLDEQEIRWGFAMVDTAMQFYRGKLENPQLRDLLGLLYYSFVEFELQQEYYIACFTERGDSERHWAEYGCADTGFVIEFDSFGLEQPSATFLDLQPVSYAVQEQAELVSDIVLACWGSTLELVRSTSNERFWVWLPYIMSLLSSHLHYHLSRLKREEFAWEKEWRVIIRGAKPIDALTGVKRFSHIPLLKTPNLSPILGVTARRTESGLALRELIRSHGFVA